MNIPLACLGFLTAFLAQSPAVAWATSTAPATYRVPVDSKDKETLAAALFTLSAAEQLDPAVVGGGFSIVYSIPEELTGNAPELRVRVVARRDIGELKRVDSFAVNGLVFAGPCRFSGETVTDKNRDLKECPDTRDPNHEEVFTLLKGRCRLGERVQCEISYGLISELISEAKRIDFIRTKYASQPDACKRMEFVSVSFGHDPVGILDLPLWQQK